MANEICPVCGCFIASGGYEIGAAVFCCELCAEDGPCDCGCESRKETLAAFHKY